MSRGGSAIREQRVHWRSTSAVPAEGEDLATLAFRAPLPQSSRPSDALVSLRPLKEFVQRLSPDHPLRVVLMEEPDEIDRTEYCVKLAIWLRLLPNEGR